MSMKAILIPVTSVMLLSACAGVIPYGVNKTSSFYGPVYVTEFAQRRDLALACNDGNMVYTSDKEACAKDYSNSSCRQFRLARDGGKGDNQDELDAICKGWRPELFAGAKKNKPMH